MADDIFGVGFKTADEIAEKVGIRADSEFRIRSGIVYTLTVAEGNGHTCLPMEALIEEAAEMLAVTPEMVEEQVEDLVYDRRIVVRVKKEEETAEVRRFVYRAEIHRHETAAARKLLELDQVCEIDEEAYAGFTIMSEAASVTLTDISYNEEDEADDSTEGEADDSTEDEAESDAEAAENGDNGV